MNDDTASNLLAKKAADRGAMDRYRAKHRRIEFFPSPDVLAIIDHHMGRGLNNCLAGVIDALIRAGDKRLSGKTST